MTLLDIPTTHHLAPWFAERARLRCAKCGVPVVRAGDVWEINLPAHVCWGNYGWLEAFDVAS